MVDESWLSDFYFFIFSLLFLSFDRRDGREHVSLKREEKEQSITGALGKLYDSGEAKRISFY